MSDMIYHLEIIARATPEYMGSGPESFAFRPTAPLPSLRPLDFVPNSDLINHDLVTIIEHVSG